MDSAGSPTINHGFDFSMLSPTDTPDTVKDDDGIFIYVYFVNIW